MSRSNGDTVGDKNTERDKKLVCGCEGTTDLRRRSFSLILKAGTKVSIADPCV